MKLGDDTVVLAHRVATGQRDAYGQVSTTTQYVVMDRCMFGPTRTQTDENRGVPSINGAMLLVRPEYGDRITQADHFLYPAVRQADGSYKGPRWELVGDVGVWKHALEVYLRRRT